MKDTNISNIINQYLDMMNHRIPDISNPGERSSSDSGSQEENSVSQVSELRKILLDDFYLLFILSHIVDYTFDYTRHFYMSKKP